MKTKLNQLFKSYQQAFDQFDTEAIAVHYKLPCLISDADGQHSYTNFEKLKSKFTDNCKTMHEMGYAGSKFSIDEVKQLGGNIVSVDINWQVQLATGPYDFSTLYLCSSENDNWLIFSAVVYSPSSQQ